MDPEAFWYHTPREVDLFLTAAGERQSDVRDVAIFGAWHIEQYSRSGKKFPGLREALERARPQKREQLPFEAEMNRWKMFFSFMPKPGTGNA